jgi:hypothetical protein
VEEQVYKCPHCDYVAKKEGYLKQHVEKKHGKGKGKKVEKPESGLCECGGQFRLLNAHVPSERQAIAAGYTKVCKKCLDLSN